MNQLWVRFWPFITHVKGKVCEKKDRKKVRENGQNKDRNGRKEEKNVQNKDRNGKKDI